MTHPAHGAITLAEIWRGPFLESAHQGHAVVCDDTGQIVEAWGVPETVVLPRSSAKMIQALPLIESGAAAAHDLTPEHLALACASHQGAQVHSERVGAWLDAIGCSDEDFKCGPQESRDITVRDTMIRAGEIPCRIHNNCSGKHTGFLTLNKHLGAGPDYVDPDHPVQKACLDAFERVTDETSPGFGIDGCSAPNFACTLHGMARAMAHFAAAPSDSAEAQLRHAMGRAPGPCGWRRPRLHTAYARDARQGRDQDRRRRVFHRHPARAENGRGAQDCRWSYTRRRMRHRANPCPAWRA